MPKRRPRKPSIQKSGPNHFTFDYDGMDNRQTLEQLVASPAGCPSLSEDIGPISAAQLHPPAAIPPWRPQQPQQPAKDTRASQATNE